MNKLFKDSAKVGCAKVPSLMAVNGNFPIIATCSTDMTSPPVLPPLSVGKMTLRLYAALNYSQNSARDLRRALNGA